MNEERIDAHIYYVYNNMKNTLVDNYSVSLNFKQVQDRKFNNLIKKFKKINKQISTIENAIDNV